MTHLTRLMLTAQAKVCSLLQLLKYLRACWQKFTQTLIVQEALCEVPSLAMYLHFIKYVVKLGKKRSQYMYSLHDINKCHIKVKEHADHAAADQTLSCFANTEVGSIKQYSLLAV